MALKKSSEKNRIWIYIVMFILGLIIGYFIGTIKINFTGKVTAEQCTNYVNTMNEPQNAAGKSSFCMNPGGAQQDLLDCYEYICGTTCGNGVLNSGEQCDDKNHISGDGCSATCTIEQSSGGDQPWCSTTVTQVSQCSDQSISSACPQKCAQLAGGTSGSGGTIPT